MRHRYGRAYRRTSARDPRLLLVVVVGVALVLVAIVMATCEPPEDLLGGSPAIWAGASYPPGGEQA
jgi:hypothetical protein